MNERSYTHWDTTLKVFLQGERQKLWRTFSDEINAKLFEGWLNNQQGVRMLKTDLFDEAVNAGFVPTLAPHADRIFGIDISNLVVDAARDRYPHIYSVTASILDLPFSDNSFDTIISNSTLDHFSTKKALFTGIQELIRVLKTDGYLLLTLDNPINPILALRQALPINLLNRSGIVPYYTGKTLSPQRLCNYLKQNGFEVDKLEFAIHCPRVLAIAISRILDKYGSKGASRRFIRLLHRLEFLSNLPTRSLTGHFTAVRAVKAS